MQESEGEFYPEKSLDRNYKIPKAKRPAIKTEQIQTPLIIPEYENVSFPSNYPGCYPATFIAPIQQNIFNTLNAIKEKPKNTYERNIFERTVPDILDHSLPKELKSLFQPLFCKLCDIQLSSNQTAKLHYNSKNHEKHIRKWLFDYSERTGEPLHRRATTTAPASESKKLENPRWFHCEICDLQLTGQQHAESHYMGKNHRKAMSGHRAPAGTGYYDSDGKWVRTKDQKSKNYDFQNGEDTFGLDFRKTETEEEPAPKKRKVEEKGDFYCEICNITMTSQVVLDSHVKGQKHLKKSKQAAVSLDEPAKVEQNEFEIIGAKPLNFYKDPFASYRTPSGFLYCQICDVNANSEAQFTQHLNSKKHIKNENTKH